MSEQAKNSAPIGVFDSGMGGLTVLDALKQQLPQESFIYLGDTARLPYGTKSPKTVQQYAVQMARILVERQIKALVIACNTSTTAALEHLKLVMPDLPVIGVVEPGAQAAVAATTHQNIAVLATETTVAANAYQQLILGHLPKAVVKARACSLLVALAEEGMVDNAITQASLIHYLQGLDDVDTILLGCTHFPVFKPMLKQLLPNDIAIVDSAEATAQALKLLLVTHQLEAPKTQIAQIKYLVTDSIARFQKVGEIFLNMPIDASNIALIDV